MNALVWLGYKHTEMQEEKTMRQGLGSFVVTSVIKDRTVLRSNLLQHFKLRVLHYDETGNTELRIMF
jgi:hypothetical protein